MMLKEVKMKTLTINYSQHIHNIVFKYHQEFMLGTTCRS